MSSDSWTPLHAKVHQTLLKRKLLPCGARILVGVSGGQDSVCLLKILLDLQSRWCWYLAIAHCDHRWSSDQGIAEHVKLIASNWGLSFYLKTAPSPIAGTEAAAREWRYQVLTEIASEHEFNWLVTGHTQSDRAETLLYNLMRGAGSEGLGSLSWFRPLTSALNLVRPLLNVTRAETYQFCQHFQLPIWEDAANQNLQFARNRVRLQLIPYLQTHFNPQVEVNLAQTADLLKTEADYLAQTAQEMLIQVMTSDRDGLNRVKLRSVHLALQRRVVREFVSNIFSLAPNFEQIETVVSLINASNRSRTPSFPGGGYFEVKTDVIIYSPKPLKTCSNSPNHPGCSPSPAI
ncbi:tRNA lysidine(34) synthetase TilS [Gloeocapsa sp. PCC 73106]|uniref:tRNA lysidine(34) synthetase TilS n=1 Tax=Gloeocapsa sp. PCC 73106 TaxID=102232 RepID=UPI0002ABC423|nr:tRNA lysidine(34) synthetase TilS [Gloeocapsa sp. PCC 73106]ELR96388.1 tRNA(Ile)-lysidine synthetase [Gloeocapsa sp. PCC 73106]